MTAPLSQDLRRRLVRAVEAGSSAREAARRFEASPSAAVEIVRRARGTGGTAPARIGGYRRPLLAGHEGLPRELTSAKPGITLAGIRDALDGRGVGPVSLATIRATLRRLGLPHEKSRPGRPSRTGPMQPPTAASGASGGATWPPTGSSSSTGPARPRTWRGATAGDRGASAWSTTRRTGIGAPRPSWLGRGAPAWSHRSSSTARMAGEAFRAYVERRLVPVPPPGDVVVLDNLSAHKVAGVRTAIAAAGASVLHLPPHSPDPNPIEQAFAKLKAGLRRVAARTRDALWAAIGGLLDGFSPEECRNRLANSGCAFE